MKKYQEPSLEVIQFKKKDIITESQLEDIIIDGGEGEEWWG